METWPVSVRKDVDVTVDVAKYGDRHEMKHKNRWRVTPGSVGGSLDQNVRVGVSVNGLRCGCQSEKDDVILVHM